MRLPDPPLLVITDRRQARRPLDEIAEALFAGGVRWLSVREKDLPADERLDLLRRLVALGRRRGACVGAHEDMAAACVVGAGALHLPDGDSVAAARAMTGDALVGVSAHDAEGLARAARDGADYATLSPIFISASKPDYGPALGLSAITEGARTTSLPIVALGGIDEATAGAAVAAGAAGVAVMGALMRAADPAAAARRLIAALGTR